MDTVFLKLMAGSRLTNYLGLRMDDGKEFLCGKNYLYIEIPVRGVVDDAGKLTQKVLRNQHVFVEAAATVNVRGSNVFEVEPNQFLAEHGQVQAGYRIHPESGERRLGFWFTARRDFDLNNMDYAVRVYMLA